MKLLRTLFVAATLLFANLSWAAVNVNTADAETLQTLHGIGQSKAEAIVKHRELHGDFKSVEELAEVKGIGEKIIEKNKEDIIVE